MRKYRDIKRLIKYIEKQGKVNAKQLAYYFDLKQHDVRLLIKYVRTNTIKILGHKKYLVADSRGYWITKDKKVIKNYISKLKGTAQDMLLQAHQGMIITNQLDKDGLVKFNESEGNNE